jgi:hypothetical protein
LRREVTEEEEEGGVTVASAGQRLAVLGVAGVALVLMFLPVLAVLGLVPAGGAAVLGSLAAGLAAAVVGVKLAAVLSGLAARFLVPGGLRRAEAAIE